MFFLVCPRTDPIDGLDGEEPAGEGPDCEDLRARGGVLRDPHLLQQPGVRELTAPA